MAPALCGGGLAFFTEEALQAAFPRTKNCDAGIDFGGDVVLAEVVSGTVKVQTRELADVGSFAQDTERIVLCKARQLYVTAGNLLRRPQPGNSPVKVAPSRIFPVVVISGQYPVNPADHPLHQRAAHRRRAPAGQHRAAAHRHAPDPARHPRQQRRTRAGLGAAHPVNHAARARGILRVVFGAWPPRAAAEVAPVYVVLASDDASYASGARIAVTGGKPNR
jgi:hypothetical protein